MKVPRAFNLLAVLCLVHPLFSATTHEARNPAKGPAPNPWVLRATLSASDNPEPFGYAVAVSGDTIVATANNSIDVYVKPKAGWGNTARPKARLSASDGASLTAVAISGNTVVAGSTQIDGTGAAYIFVEPSGGWSDMPQTAKLTASDGVGGDFFGISVAISGSTVVVGSLQNNSVGIVPEPNGNGAAYVYVKASTGWINTTETAKLTASDGLIGDDFGFSVVVQGEVIAVAAPNAVVNSTRLEGAVYIFQKSGSQWKNGTQTAKLTASDGHEITVLGTALSINGTTLAAAAQDKVYLFIKPTSGWKNSTQSAELASLSYNLLGPNSVAINNDDVITGAPFSQHPYADLYLESAKSPGNMTPSYRFKAPADNQDGSFGWSVSIDASTIVVGSPLASGVGGNLVYVYEKK